MDNCKKVLIDCVGDKGFETLQKAIVRKKTNSMADPLELYLPLLVVPRAILSWLVQNIHPLKVGEYKEFKFPGKESVTILVEKMDTDVYRGEFYEGGKVIHRFDHQTLPAVSGHLLTVFELYSDLDMKDTPKEEPKSEKLDTKMISAIMAMNNIVPPKDRSALDQENVSALIGSVGKLVDALVLTHLQRTPTILHLNSKDEPKEEPKEGPKEDEKEPVKPEETKKEEIKPQPEKVCATPKSGYFRKKIEKIAKGVEMPAGAGQPKGPTPPKPPVPPSNKKQSRAAQQAQMSGTGKVPSTTNTKQTGIKPPTIQPVKTIKAEGYFQGKLKRVRKTETQFFTEEQLYKECKHCGTAQFKKTEHGPKHAPCWCYKTLPIKIEKKEKGYDITINGDLDQVESFAKALRG